MKNKKKRLAQKILLSIGVFVVSFMFTGILKSKAGTEHNMTGWLWSSADDGAGNNNGIGYVSINNSNPGAGGSVSYGVNIPTSDGAVTGSAWSETLGYIDFVPAGPYPGAPNTPVMRVGNKLQGWARFSEIQNAAATGNSGGWQGWIKLSGTASDGSPYGVMIDSPSGSNMQIRGYAWSDELGAISFNGSSYGTSIPAPPVVKLNSTVMTINLDEGLLPKPVTLTWTVTDATSCTKSGGAWGSGASTDPASGSETVSQTVPNVTYKISCSGPGGTSEDTYSVTTGCNKRSCSANTCVSSLMVTGEANNSKCVAQSVCAGDSDCAPREVQSWKEVSAN